MMVYEADFKDETFYARDTFSGIEDDGSVFIIKWIPISEFVSGKLRLVPEGLLDFIK